jgi:hypothetical protein
LKKRKELIDRALLIYSDLLDSVLRGSGFQSGSTTLLTICGSGSSQTISRACGLDSKGVLRGSKCINFRFKQFRAIRRLVIKPLSIGLEQQLQFYDDADEDEDDEQILNPHDWSLGED